MIVLSICHGWKRTIWSLALYLHSFHNKTFWWLCHQSLCNTVWMEVDTCLTVVVLCFMWQLAIRKWFDICTILSVLKECEVLLHKASLHQSYIRGSFVKFIESYWQWSLMMFHRENGGIQSDASSKHFIQEYLPSPCKLFCYVFIFVLWRRQSQHW